MAAGFGYARRVTVSTRSATSGKRVSFSRKCASCPCRAAASTSAARSRMAPGVCKYAYSVAAPGSGPESTIEATALGLGQLVAVGHGSLGEIAGRHLRVHFDTGVGRDQ